MHLVFTRTPGDRQFTVGNSGLSVCLCHVFRAQLTPLCVDSVGEVTKVDVWLTEQSSWKRKLVFG